MTDEPIYDDLRCSFCRKSYMDVQMMMGSEDDRVHICDECLFTGMVMLAQSESKAVNFEALVVEARNHPKLTEFPED